MSYKEGWLSRRLESASTEYNSWPDNIKVLFKNVYVEEGEPMSDVEYRMRYNDSRKYGNY